MANGSNGSKTLQSVNPATGVGTTINSNMIQQPTYYYPDIPAGTLQNQEVTALAWDLSRGKLWFSNVPANGQSYIFSYDIATNTVGLTWTRFRNASNAVISNPRYRKLCRIISFGS